MTLDFSEQQLNYVLQVLSSRPYGEVVELFADLQRQVTTQRGGARLQPVEGFQAPGQPAQGG